MCTTASNAQPPLALSSSRLSHLFVSLREQLRRTRRETTPLQSPSGCNSAALMFLDRGLPTCLGSLGNRLYHRTRISGSQARLIDLLVVRSPKKLELVVHRNPLPCNLRPGKPPVYVYVGAGPGPDLDRRTCMSYTLLIQHKSCSYSS